MIRGPRPWEDNSDYHKKIAELEEKNKEKNLKFKMNREKLIEQAQVDKKSAYRP